MTISQIVSYVLNQVELSINDSESIPMLSCTIAIDDHIASRYDFEINRRIQQHGWTGCSITRFPASMSVMVVI